MGHALNNDTQQKARDLARQITVAHDLDPEIQEELYGHIEDKLLAYKNGEERITDEDAFILVREHFGDAKELKAMLQDVHVEVMQVTLVRRVLALVIVLLAAGWASAGLNGLAHMVSVPFFDSSNLPSTFQFQLCVTYPLSILILLGTFGVLYHWNRRMLAGNAPWFFRWSISRMVQWIALLLVLRGAVPHFDFSSPTSPNPISPLAMGLLYGHGVITMVGYCLLWLWWTDVLAGRLFQQFLVGTMWVLYSFLLSLYPVGLLIQLGADQVLHGGRLPITEFHMGDVAISVYFYGIFIRPEIYWFYFGSPLVQAFCVFLCAIVLQGLHHPWRKGAEANSVSELSW